MATKQIRSTPVAEAQPHPSAAPWQWAMEFGRQQAAVASESTSTVLRGLQALRGIQEQAAREASQRHANIAAKMRKPCTPAELLALQGELWRDELQASARYWQQLAGATMEIGTELCACGVQLVDTEDVLAATSPRFLHS